MTARTSPPKMTEREVQAAIVTMAKRLGFRVYHTQYSIGSQPGFPDLVVCGHSRLFVWEVKGPRGKVSDEQDAWIIQLQLAGINAMIVYPDDLDDVLDELMTAYQEAHTG